MLRADGLSVAYGDVVALRDVGFVVAPGMMLAVTGPSGAGKSTLLWALAGALRPRAGTVHLDDRAVTRRTDAARRGIALIPQGNGLARLLTAHENVLAPLLALGRPPANARDSAATGLAAVGLEESGSHLVDELSGGQQQRVAVARAVASQPAVLLADEPTSELDEGNCERVIGIFRDLRDAGAIVVMATHDPAAAAQADAEIRLDEGVMEWARPMPDASVADAPGAPDRP